MHATRNQKERGDRKDAHEIEDADVQAGLLMRPWLAEWLPRSVFAMPLERPIVGGLAQHEASFARMRHAAHKHTKTTQRGG